MNESQSRARSSLRLAGKYYLATISWTWGVWIPLIVFAGTIGDLASMQQLPLWQQIALVIWLQLGGYGPTIVAVLFSVQKLGGDGVRSLFKRLLIWRVQIRWYLVVLLLPAILQLAAIGFFIGFFDGQVGSVEWQRAPLILVTFFTLILFGPLAEELGWRGFLLPRLLDSGSALRASLIMGLMVTIWHCPLFLSTFPPMSGVSLVDETILYYFAYTTGRCVLYTWIFQNTRQSVLMTVLFHAAGNTAIPLLLLSGISPETKGQIMLLSGVVMCVFAIWVIQKYGWKKLRIDDGPTG